MKIYKVVNEQTLFLSGSNIWHGESHNGMCKPACGTTKRLRRALKKRERNIAHALVEQELLAIEEQECEDALFEHILQDMEDVAMLDAEMQVVKDYVAMLDEDYDPLYDLDIMSDTTYCPYCGRGDDYK